MDLGGAKFGRGPRELGGAVDLVNYYKVWPHYELFCKRSLPLSISESCYLENIVGDTEIRKGEGMELDQLFQTTSYVGDRHSHIRPFGLDILREAFQMREITPIELPSAEKGIHAAVLKSKDDAKEKKKHKKRKHRDKEKHKDQKKHNHHDKDSSRDKDQEKSRNGHHEFGPDPFQKQQDKHENSKINQTGSLKIARRKF